MATSPIVQQLCQEYIQRNVIPSLPEEIGAVTLEVISWHIRVHTYQYTVFEDGKYERLAVPIESLVDALPERQPEPWQATLAQHRVERGGAFHYEGEVLYERWSEL